MQEIPAKTGKQSDGAAQLIERARHILAFEQRNGHQDNVVKPGGIEAFIERWTTQMRAARDRGEIAAPPAGASGRLPEVAILHLLTGYRALDPMQRAAKIRASLALLDAFNTPGTPRSPDAAPQTRSAAPGSRSAREAPRFGQPAPGRSTTHPSTPAPDESWPLAKPLPKPPVLPAQRPRFAEPPREPRPEDEYLIQAAVTAVPGVGATQEARLARLGIQTVRDLLFAFPREHHDYSKLQKIAQLPFDQVSTTLGLIWEVENKRTKNGRTRTVARVSDETGAVYATWFNQPYLLKQLPRGGHIVMTGTKQRFGNRVEFAVKSHELPEQGDLINTGRLVPVYPLTEGLSPKVMRRFTKWVVDRCAAFVPDHLPAEVRSKAKLMPLPDAIAEMHYPQNAELLEAARRRLAFDELFLIQLGMLTRRANWKDSSPAPAMPVPDSLIFADAPESETPPATNNPGGGLWPLTATCFERTLPFRLTGAQCRAIREILADMRDTHPMSRLLQGDVGSGKTVVAAAALLAAAANGYQGALLAPTEILAEQHYRGLSALLAPFGLHVVLLTGSQRAKERNAARDALANGQAAVAIGTHALIQDGVTFARLGLAVVDEQHRFGVEQRDALRQKGYNPHMLVMTATPIPRTLALTLYGDLDVSVLDEMPAGRQPIITRWRSGSQRQEAYRLVSEEVAKGRQA
ncbi:MAG TPA: DEAD/DEAH box helicase, partial [Ktedonobacterales bacterium]